jgi:hypothetical protein
LPLTSIDWTEDLKRQAVRGYEIGKEHCTCEGHYHVLWGALRASGFLGSLKSEEATFARVVSPLIRNGTKILVGGAADTGTLCAIGRAAGSAQPDIFIVDRCAAPLLVIEEICRSKAIPCQVLQEDLLNLKTVGKWDVIVLNYIYTFIELEMRPRFFAQIAASLNPGGTLICLAKLAAPLKKENADDLNASWYTNAHNKLINSDLGISWDREILEETLLNWAEARAARRINFMSAEQIHNALIDSGLQVVGEYVTNREWAITSDAGADVEGSLVIHAQNGA